MHDTALLIGRFEPVHSGHLALLQEALRQAPQVIVVVGSAWQPRSPKNPFTWQEREAMLREAQAMALRIPRTGMALLFQHMLLHSGERVVSGIKYVLRSDILFGEARDADAQDAEV